MSKKRRRSSHKPVGVYTRDDAAVLTLIKVGFVILGVLIAAGIMYWLGTHRPR